MLNEEVFEINVANIKTKEEALRSEERRVGKECAI